MNVDDYKSNAVNFLELVVQGKIDEASEKYLDIEDGKHHNLFFESGFPHLLKAMQENQVSFPHKKMIVKNVIGEGNMVAVHGHVIHKPGDLGYILVHIFRFDNHGKIIEMWDSGQEIQKDSPNEDGRF